MAPLALIKQNYRNFEVIFVDDGSTDSTYNLISTKYQSKLPKTKLIRNASTVGLRKVRNQGAKATRAEVKLVDEFSGYVVGINISREDLLRIKNRGLT